MSNLLYPKLAAINIKNHGRLYIPYIISSVVTVAMFYVLCAITGNDGITALRGADSLAQVLFLGCIVIAIFSLIFLLYTNSFLMKQRKTEMGLFNVLGMEKRHISRILFFETLYVGLISIILGLGFGIVFDKLVTLILCKLLHFSVTTGFYISLNGILLSIALFSAIFIVSLIVNIAKIRRASTIELLHSSSTGEKEPRTKWVLAVIGVIALAIGYTIAIVVKSPLSALLLFFIAVICVIIGTYCLFSAGSIAILKLMRKNKNYFYQAKHFNSVSGMLYRMKQNAVGLGNICILSTMVLVMISATVSLYAGAEDAVSTRYPKDMSIEVKYAEGNEEVSDIVLDAAKKCVSKNGYTMSDTDSVSFLSFATTREGDTFNASDYNYSGSASVHELCFVTANTYKELTGNEVTLKPNEVLVYSSAEQMNDSFSIFGQTYTVKQKLESFPTLSNFSAVLLNVHSIVVSDDSVIKGLYKNQKAAFGENASEITYNLRFNINGTDEEKVDFIDPLADSITSAIKGSNYHATYLVDSKQTNREDFYAMYGTFLFLGIVLGILFLMVTVMIIYYKQVSEGYDDKRRFEIMQQVGMSKEEVKKTISNQILTVFFLPLVTAFIHLAFAFPIISRVMVVFNFTNTAVFAIGLLATAVAFAVIYAIVYALTAKTYYKIVSK